MLGADGQADRNPAGEADGVRLALILVMIATVAVAGLRPQYRQFGSALPGYQVGNAISLDGATKYFTYQNQVCSGTNFTVSAWVYIAQPMSNNIVLAERYSQNSTSIRAQLYTTGGKIAFIIRNDAGNASLSTGTTTLSSNNWYHVAGVRNGVTNQVWLNGVKEFETNNAPGSITTDTYTIGNAGGSTTYWTPTYYAGRIDEVAVWTRALSAVDISELYATRKRAGNLVSGTNNLVARWSMDASSGTNAVDSIANNTAIGTGIVNSDWVPGRVYK